jgi:hypothetical protein
VRSVFNDEKKLSIAALSQTLPELTITLGSLATQSASTKVYGRA